MLIAIDEPEDARIATFRNIRDRDLRGGHGGGFIAEGESVLNVFARQTLYERAALLVAADRVDIVARLDLPEDLPVYVAGQAVMDGIVGFPIHRGLLGLGRRGADRSADAILRPRPPLVVGLVGVANHDNMGGIFRNAAAFGAGGVLIDPSSCDPLYRKALRVSVGGSLVVPHARLDAMAMIDLLRQAGYRILGLSPAGRQDLADIAADRPTALLLGAEGPGLPAAVMAQIETVRIDMAGGFDSLNVATTSGIALYQLTRGRR